MIGTHVRAEHAFNDRSFLVQLVACFLFAIEAQYRDMRDMRWLTTGEKKKRFLAYTKGYSNSIMI